MTTVIEGKLEAPGMKLGIVVSRYNNFITEKLLAGALDGVKSHGGEEQDVTVVRVPGAFEIPLIAECMAASRKFDRQRDAVQSMANFRDIRSVSVIKLIASERVGASILEHRHSRISTRFLCREGR